MGGASSKPLSARDLLMDLDNIIEYLPDLFQGLMTTLGLVVVALLLGTVLAGLMTMACVSGKPWLKRPVRGFMFFIRGTPLLVQIFLIYYGSSQFQALRESILWIAFKEPFFCALLALAINSSAYTTEIFLGAIRSIPKGELQAANAYGMSWGLRLRRIIFPRAWSLAIPAYSNEVIMLIKGSSLASTITLLDLMGMTQQIINRTYATIEFYLIAGTLYLILNSIILSIFRWLERRNPSISRAF